MSQERALLGVTGRPVFHSLSPTLFGLLFNAAGVEGDYLRLAAAGAEESLGLFAALGLRGMNVTAPYKESVKRLLDDFSDEAVALGAINCVFRAEGGRLYGGNSDPAGVSGSLEAAGVKIAGARSVVIGAGGAGKSAAYALSVAGAKVEVVNRTVDRSDNFFAELGIGVTGLEDLASRAASADIVVSSLMSANLPDPGSWFPRGAGSAQGGRLVVLDADYRDGLLYRHAKREGCVAVSGIDWLVHQGLPAYRLFVGPPPQVDPAAVESELVAFDRTRRRGAKGVALYGGPPPLGIEVAAALAASLGLPFAEAPGRRRGPEVVFADAELCGDAEAFARLKADHAAVLLLADGRRPEGPVAAADLVLPCADRTPRAIAAWIHEEVAHVL